MAEEFNRLQLYENRELSWLRFNMRVLEEAQDEGVPLFERLRFVSIFTSNLDEFFMIRVGSLHDQTLLKRPLPDSRTGMSPAQQIAAIFDRAKQMIPRKDHTYFNIMSQLATRNIEQVSLSNLSKEELGFLEKYFAAEVMPLLSAQVIDKHHPFPFLRNKELYVGVHLATKGNFVKLGIIPVSGGFDRMLFLPAPSGSLRFVLVEDLIWLFADRVFKNYKVLDKTIFRVTRNADINVEEALYDEDVDFRYVMSELLKKRKKLTAVRLELYNSVNVELMKTLCARLELSQEHVFITKCPLDFSFVGELEDHISRETSADLFYEPLSPQNSPAVVRDIPMMRQIAKNDILLSYPYESIEPFIRLLNEAAQDNSVVSIKITLYRVASNSKVIDALIRAAENGKDVLVVVELRARFDEENNIGWSKQLEEAGCTVIYGLDEYKVHSKLLLITRKVGNHVEYFTQIGTGNYNEKTSRLYTDYSLMTADRDIGADASIVFNCLSIGSLVEYSKKLLVSPLCLKSKVIQMIDGEIACAKSSAGGRIVIKLNSLSDKVLIDKLIEASEAGVKIDLIIRGICCLHSGIPGHTDTITVHSVVGRFLEHARIYVFGEGERQRVYISSADFMTRNTERRVEVAAPIQSPALRQRLLEMLDVMMRDTVKRRVQQPDGDYIHVTSEEEPLDSQLYFSRQAYERARLAQEAPGTAGAGTKEHGLRRLLERLRKNRK